MFLLNLIPAPYRMTALLVAVIVGASACLYAGWSLRDLQAEAHEAELLRAHERLVAEAHKKNRTVHDQVAAELALERAWRQTESMEFKEKLRNEDPTRLVSCAKPKAPTRVASTPLLENEPQAAAQPLPEPEPAPVFTARFVGLWNDALQVGLAETYRAGRPDGAVDGAGLADPRRLLANVEANGERHNACGAKIRAWQRWACSHGFAGESLCRQALQ